MMIHPLGLWPKSWCGVNLIQRREVGAYIVLWQVSARLFDMSDMRNKFIKNVFALSTPATRLLKPREIGEDCVRKGTWCKTCATSIMQVTSDPLWRLPIRSSRRIDGEMYLPPVPGRNIRFMIHKLQRVWSTFLAGKFRILKLAVWSSLHASGFQQENFWTFWNTRSFLKLDEFGQHDHIGRKLLKHWPYSPWFRDQTLQPVLEIGFLRYGCRRPSRCQAVWLINSQWLL